MTYLRSAQTGDFVFNRLRSFSGDTVLVSVMFVNNEVGAVFPERKFPA